MSRVFLIAVDQSAEQTKRIIGYQNRKSAGLIDLRKEQQLKSYLQLHYNGHHQTTELTLREIRQALGASKSQVFRYANDLCSLEYIRQSGG